jgi:cytochrome c oxidase cbb3-type subunit III
MAEHKTDPENADHPPTSLEEPLDHEYDGIQEFDNPLPRWWVNIFWGSFVFALVYVGYYHLSGRGESVVEEYAGEISEAREVEAKRAMGDKLSEESLAQLASNAGLMQDARGIFEARCVQCHKARGEGGIGPNLTDGYWIHGKGTLMDIYAVVNDGVQAKGMPPWGRQLTPIELGKVVAYVGTLRNTNAPGKAPEGHKVAGR